MQKRVLSIMSLGLIIFMVAVISGYKSNKPLGPASNTNITTLIGGFKNPSIDYRPKVRWWWPGGDVQEAELKRELHLLKDNMFGGAEIQPFAIGINPKTMADKNDPVHDVGSGVYYKKLAFVMEEAKSLGLVIDLTMGSGWCAGGTMVPVRDNENTLVFGEATVNSDVNMKVPEFQMPYAYNLFSTDIPSRTNVIFKVLHYHPEEAVLIAVVAAKITDNKRSPDPAVMNDVICLDYKTTIDITDHIKDGQIQWELPSPGQWQVIALYSMPAGSSLVGSAEAGGNYMVNPLSSKAITRFFDNWLGKQSEILKYAGNPLRSLFNDSYEFFSQRLYGDDLLSTFQKNRGYDVTPFLPAVLIPGRNQAFFGMGGGRSSPEFTFGDDLSNRINYDYDLTISDLFFDNWYKASEEWGSKHNLKIRQQGYNPPLDVIRAAGAVDIPETEGLQERTLKRVSSGAHLYGKTLVTAESFVFYPGGTFSLTPQKYKQGIDLLMTSGVNEILYHGMPYRYEKPGYGEFGWAPFAAPSGTEDINTIMAECDSAIWPNMATINSYAARLQYLLQQGTSVADIIVYLPIFDSPTDRKFDPVINMLDRYGYTWEWINEELIGEAEWTGSAINVRGRSFKGIVLSDIQSISVPAVQKIAGLAKMGAPVVMYGKAPERQPGYFNYLGNDKIVVETASGIKNFNTSLVTTDSVKLEKFIRSLPSGKINYKNNASLRYITRDLGNGNHLALLRNVTNDVISFALNVDPSFKNCYWFEATTGNIYKAEIGNGTITGKFAGNGSIVILCLAEGTIEEQQLSTGDPLYHSEVFENIPVLGWKLEVQGGDIPNGNITVTQEALGDWSQKKELMYVSSKGLYTAKFEVSEVQHNSAYRLNLGSLSSSAIITINGKQAGSVYFAPYMLDVTSLIKPGVNTITIVVQPPLRNRFLGKGKSGDPEYAQFAGRESIARVGGASSPIFSGLAGPVFVEVIRK